MVRRVCPEAQTPLGERRGSEAAQEFQLITRNRGVDPADPLYPLAHLGLARAAAMAGELGVTKKAYEDLFDLWSRADPDLPALAAARAEYRRVGGS